MSKYVISLCASLYLVLIIFGAPSEDAPIVAETSAKIELTPATEAPAAALPVETAKKASEPLISQSAVIAADTPVTTLIEIATTPVTVQPLETGPTERTSTSIATEPKPAPIPVVTAAVAEPKPIDLWTVTASRVNLREGPGTSNPVIDTALRGETAEMIEILDNGWARIRLMNTGTEAYMAARFLARAPG